MKSKHSEETGKKQRLKNSIVVSDKIKTLKIPRKCQCFALVIHFHPNCSPHRSTHIWCGLQASWTSWLLCFVCSHCTVLYFAVIHTPLQPGVNNLFAIFQLFFFFKFLLFPNWFFKMSGWKQSSGPPHCMCFSILGWELLKLCTGRQSWQ